MKDRTALTIACFHISAAACVLFGICLLLLAKDGSKTDGLSLGLAAFLFLFFLALALGVEFLVIGLKRRKFWAWIAGIIVSGIYISSPLLPLGALGLWGLLAAGSRKAFGVRAGPVSAANPSLEPTPAAAGSREDSNATGGGSRKTS